MKNVPKSVSIVESRLSEQMAANDDAAANEEEVDEQIEGDNVEKEARENGTIAPAPIMRSNEEIKTADDAVAAREEVEEQAEETMYPTPKLKSYGQSMGEMQASHD